MVYQLIYTSSATSALDDFALRDIAHSSNLNNQKIGITGLLIFHEGSIMQVLEGDKESVSSLYNKVKHDNRHKGCMILNQRISDRREFPNWFMGYKNVSGQKNAEALFHLSQDTLRAALPSEPSQEIAALTKAYAKVAGL